MCVCANLYFPWEKKLLKCKAAVFGWWLQYVGYPCTRPMSDNCCLTNLYAETSETRHWTRAERYNLCVWQPVSMSSSEFSYSFISDIVLKRMMYVWGCTHLCVMVLAWERFCHSGDTPDKEGLFRENWLCLQRSHCIRLSIEDLLSSLCCQVSLWYLNIVPQYTKILIRIGALS